MNPSALSNKELVARLTEQAKLCRADTKHWTASLLEAAAARLTAPGTPAVIAIPERDRAAVVLLKAEARAGRACWRITNGGYFVSNRDVARLAIARAAVDEAGLLHGPEEWA